MEEDKEKEVLQTACAQEEKESAPPQEKEPSEEMRSQKCAKDEALFSSVSELGEREIAVLSRYYSNKFIALFGVIFPLVFLLLAFAMGFLDNDPVFGIVMCVIAAVSVPLVVFGFPAMVKKNSLKNATMLGAESEVLVTKDKILLRDARGGETISSAAYPLQSLFKVVRYRGFVLLFLSKMQACMMDETRFLKGTAEECLAFFASCNIPVYGKRR